MGLFIAMNHFSVDPERGGEFEEHWRKRESYLAEVPGFLRFALLRGDEPGLRPALAHRLEDRDGRGEQCRLGLLGQIELLGRPGPDELADGLAERRIGCGEDGPSGRGGHGEVPAHAHRLRALAGKDECDR